MTVKISIRKERKYSIKKSLQVSNLLNVRTTEKCTYKSSFQLSYHVLLQTTI